MKNLLKKLAILLVLVGCNGGAAQAMDLVRAEVAKSAEGALEAVREGVRKYPLTVAGVAVAGVVGVVYLYQKDSGPKAVQELKNDFALEERINDQLRDEIEGLKLENSRLRKQNAPKRIVRRDRGRAE